MFYGRAKTIVGRAGALHRPTVAPPLLKSLFLDFQRSCDVISNLKDVPMFFFFVKLLIRVSHTNWTEYCCELDESFRNVVLKWTKYYANSYYRKSLCLKQDKQDSQSIFGAPPERHSRLNSTSFAFALLQLHDPFTTLSIAGLTYTCMYC